MAMRTLIKLWFEYVTIWIKNNGKKTVEVFTTEQFQMVRDFCTGIYLDKLVFIIPCCVKLKTAWGISKELGPWENWESSREKCLIFYIRMSHLKVSKYFSYGELKMLHILFEHNCNIC